MVTVEKFFEALKKIKVEGRWSMGLIISAGKTVDFASLEVEKEELVVEEASSAEEILEKTTNAFSSGKWVIWEIKKILPVELYNQLKSLSAQNSLQLSDGTILHQPDSSRLVVVADSDTIKNMEKDYPGFKYLFGPVITL